MENTNTPKEEKNQLQLKPCKGCKAEIGFIKTKQGKKMPVDPKKVTVVTKGGSVVTGYISHFATCPEAKQFRNKKNAQERKPKQEDKADSDGTRSETSNQKVSDSEEKSNGVSA